MPKFFYKVKDKDGAMTDGLIQAANEDKAADLLMERQYVILWLKEQKEGFASRAGKILNRVSTKDLVIFSRQLSILISANVPLVSALQILVQQTKSKHFKLIISDIGDDVEGGAKLSNALAKYTYVFDNLFISIVRSGETSGKLDEVLLFLADQQEKDYDLISKIRGAMIYPIFILFGLAAVGTIMMMFVVPKMTGILEEVGGELPLSTKILIGTSDFLVGYWWLVAIVIIGLLVTLRVITRTEGGKKRWDYIVIHSPVFGNLMQKINIVRFARSLRTLLEGGVPLPKSLKIASEVVTNQVYKDIIASTIKEVEDGKSIASVFLRHKEMPVMVSQMLNIGEQTGRIDQILEKITHFYSREIENLVRNLVTLIEPFTIVLIGLAVGTMIAAIILPIYNLSGSL